MYKNQTVHLSSHFSQTKVELFFKVKKELFKAQPLLFIFAIFKHKFTYIKT